MLGDLPMAMGRQDKSLGLLLLVEDLSPIEHGSQCPTCLLTSPDTPLPHPKLSLRRRWDRPLAHRTPCPPLPSERRPPRAMSCSPRRLAAQASGFRRMTNQERKPSSLAAPAKTQSPEGRTLAPSIFSTHPSGP